jgi:hypothetical protein
VIRPLRPLTTLAADGDIIHVGEELTGTHLTRLTVPNDVA